MGQPTMTEIAAMWKYSPLHVCGGVNLRCPTCETSFKWDPEIELCVDCGTPLCSCCDRHRCEGCGGTVCQHDMVWVGDDKFCQGCQEEARMVEYQCSAHDYAQAIGQAIREMR